MSNLIKFPEKKLEASDGKMPDHDRLFEAQALIYECFNKILDLGVEIDIERKHRMDFIALSLDHGDLGGRPQRLKLDINLDPSANS